MDWIKEHWYVVLLIVLAITLLVGVVGFFISYLATLHDERWLKKYEMRRSDEDKTLELLARKSCYGRASVTRVFNMRIHIDITTQSGNSEWSCIIDFNDKGKLTGEYKIYSENDQSTIPQIIAEKIREDIISA